ncbi:hypothetical protein [Thermomonospora cellulosilytica]|uniref:Uncharacterized protein n=1 Tax=Thermomonospora cellulosilytica TaxID=1411118 RepID=A0A7W3MVK9_9ACTN|nr:hypothetical protein [Thermomonospora cellulosilytica]MBA9002727.1 hypothetical protein [Thermomonospora cellulosilytica]
MQRLGTLFGSIVAPTTLVTGLLYYFGHNYAHFFFGHFGVDSSTLGLTTADYMRRIVDPLFIPITVIALAGLAALWIHAEVRIRFAEGLTPRMIRGLLPFAAVTGLLLAAAGTVSVFAVTPLSHRLAAAPLTLAAGVLLLTYAHHLRRRLRPTPVPPAAAIAEWATVFVLLGMTLFWAVTDYAAAVAVSRARWYAARLDTLPDAVLYSERGLNLTGPGVREIPCTRKDAAYRFRYEGLKLILRSGDQYLFLPKDWTRRNGTAFLLPRTPALRLEFTHPTSRPPAPPTC